MTDVSKIVNRKHQNSDFYNYLGTQLITIFQKITNLLSFPFSVKSILSQLSWVDFRKERAERAGGPGEGPGLTDFHIRAAIFEPARKLKSKISW